MNIVFFESEQNFPQTDERFQHITRVLKKGVGETFFAGIKNGPEGIAHITRVDASGISFDFQELRPMRPLYPVYMIVGFPRPIQLRRLLRDLASLGTSKIMLAGTDLGERSYRESRLADPAVAKKNILDGCMQAGATGIPVLSMDDSVDRALERIQCEFSNGNTAGAPVKLLLDVSPQSIPLARANFSGVGEQSPLILAIGSERGWTARERGLFIEAGFTVCSLGSRILRTETAATAALAIALASAGFMEEKNESRSN